MASAIWQGIMLGFGLAFLIGPVFFLILFTSINKGFKPAAAIAIGVMLSDALCIVIAQFGNEAIKKFPLVQHISSIAGGVLLVIFGLQGLLKKPRLRNAESTPYIPSKRNAWYNVTHGFVVNTLNPFALIFWIGVVSAMSSKVMTNGHTWAFYISALGMVLITDLAKSYAAASIQHLLNLNVIKWMNIISGIALILFGIKVLSTIAY